MTRAEDTMAGTETEAAIRIEVVAAVVVVVEAIIIPEVGGEAVLVEAGVATTGEGEVGKEELINRSTMWALLVVATTHREASQTTMTMFRVGRVTMLRFLLWAVEAYLTASKIVVRFLAKIQSEYALNQLRCHWTTGALEWEL